MTHYQRVVDAMCSDCGHDCRDMGEMFMLDDQLWHDTCMADRSVVCVMLCVGCVEARLGRPLRRRDFTGAPINSEVDKSLRLRKALAA